MPDGTKCGDLYWDEERGYGYVVFDGHFRREEPIQCLDAISDWVTGMTNEYNDHITRSRQTFDALRRKAKRVSSKS